MRKEGGGSPVSLSLSDPTHIPLLDEVQREPHCRKQQARDFPDELGGRAVKAVEVGGQG